ncbi:MAG: spore germination protein GerW family protein [Candidatus Limnocylindrales bacterium]
MDASEILNHARDAMTVKRVFGDPYEKDGVTVIPVANVIGGVGAGGGSSAGARPPSTSHETTGEGAGDSGHGMGYGLRATPAGVYVIRGGEVEWQPALDPNRLTLQRALVVIVALLVLRSITKTLVRR